MSIVEKLTEGIVNRDMAKEGQALLSKWSQTGLLEGLGDEREVGEGLPHVEEDLAAVGPRRLDGDAVGAALHGHELGDPAEPAKVEELGSCHEGRF